MPQSGGKGMRIVKKESELKDSIISAKREALSGFGDDRIFIERYVEKSRHHQSLKELLFWRLRLNLLIHFLF